MTTVSCIAIEDEPHALDLIQHYVKQVPYLQWLGGFQQPLQALPLLNEGKVQLLFLDINLPKVDGIAFYKSLTYKPAVIFTTAYAEYAVKGFEIEATDYLVKPIQLERFVQACNKVLKAFPTPKAQPLATETIYVKSGAKWHQLNWQDVLFMEKDENYVIFHTVDNRKILTRQNLGDVDTSAPSYFCRVHKSFIINLNKVDVVERESIQIGNRKIPLADSYRSSFMKASGIQ